MYYFYHFNSGRFYNYNRPWRFCTFSITSYKCIKHHLKHHTSRLTVAKAKSFSPKQHQLLIFDTTRKALPVGVWPHWWRSTTPVLFPASIYFGWFLLEFELFSYAVFIISAAVYIVFYDRVIGIKNDLKLLLILFFCNIPYCIII